MLVVVRDPNMATTEVQAMMATIIAIPAPARQESTNSYDDSTLLSISNVEELPLVYFVLDESPELLYTMLRTLSAGQAALIR